MEFISGGLAGAGATVFTNPMDVLKTRMQLEGELRARVEPTARYRGIFHAIAVICRSDGVFGLQRGLAPAMMLGFTMNSVRLGLYHIAEVQGWTKTAIGDVNIKKAVFWSATSGYLSGLIANPVAVVKTRMQVTSHPSIAVGKQYRYKGVADAFATIYKTEGVRGYFVGVNAACTRLLIGSAAQLTTFSTAKQTLVNYNLCTNSRVLLSFCASAISGFVVAIAACPFDVTAVRLFNQGTKGTLLYNGVFDCLYKIWKTEGLQGLYKGIWPLYLRIAPHTTLSLVIWDFLNNIRLMNKTNS